MKKLLIKCWWNWHKGAISPTKGTNVWQFAGKTTFCSTNICVYSIVYNLGCHYSTSCCTLENLRQTLCTEKRLIKFSAALKILVILTPGNIFLVSFTVLKNKFPFILFVLKYWRCFYSNNTRRVLDSRTTISAFGIYLIDQGYNFKLLLLLFKIFPFLFLSCFR